MNKKSMLIGIILCSMIASVGCSAKKTVLAPTPSTRSDVFLEYSGSGAETGKAIADITFSVKDVSARFFETYYRHSNPPLQVHLDIDGQTTILDAEPLLEDKSSVKSESPESGTGWRYHFSKRIVTSPGKHKLTIMIPVDKVFVEHDIFLEAGVNTLSLNPVYKMKSPRRPYKKPHFSAGVKTIEVIKK